MLPDQITQQITGRVREVYGLESTFGLIIWGLLLILKSKTVNKCDAQYNISRDLVILVAPGYIYSTIRTRQK